ncbi:MAG TPA: hypothetical protein VJ869_13965 [Sphaerochaeta sp.]|nr:hypothetical protein [Sphaerochaeta sp.]
MNKTWSIILIVVACIGVLGGTYWYFGMQEPKKVETPTPFAVVEPAKEQSPAAKESPIEGPRAKAEPLLPKATAALEESPVTPASQAKPAAVETVQESLPEETPNVKPIPSPIAPTISKGGLLGLPIFGSGLENETVEKEKPTSVLANEALPVKEDAGTLPAIEEKKPNLVAKESVEQQELPLIAENSSETLPQDVQLSVVTEKPTEALPEVELKDPSSAVATPPALKILRSGTALVGDETKSGKASIDASLSVSFLDYSFPQDFTSPDKGFNISLDVMSQKEVFGWGGSLEFAKFGASDIQISLLAKAVWSLGKGVVTYPLSISLGPTLFLDSATNDTGFGLKAKIGSGVTYAISESFRFFYAIGVGATYNFQDSSSLKFVLEPIRVGVGFSF